MSPNPGTFEHERRQSLTNPRPRTLGAKVASTMSNAIQIRMGGYGPPTTGFSRALKFIGDRLKTQFGNRVDIKYIWNIMDFGYRAEDILWLVEHGLLTLGYQSSSYFTDRVPPPRFVFLPFLFSTPRQAPPAIDPPLAYYPHTKTQ